MNRPRTWTETPSAAYPRCWRWPTTRWCASIRVERLEARMNQTGCSMASANPDQPDVPVLMLGSLTSRGPKSFASRKDALAEREPTMRNRQRWPGRPDLQPALELPVAQHQNWRFGLVRGRQMTEQCESLRPPRMLAWKQIKTGCYNARSRDSRATPMWEVETRPGQTSRSHWRHLRDEGTMVRQASEIGAADSAAGLRQLRPAGCRAGARHRPLARERRGHRLARRGPHPRAASTTANRSCTRSPTRGS